MKHSRAWERRAHRYIYKKIVTMEIFHYKEKLPVTKFFYHYSFKKSFYGSFLRDLQTSAICQLKKKKNKVTTVAPEK